MNNQELLEQEDRLNREYNDILDYLDCDIICESNYIILYFILGKNTIFFKNEKKLREFLDFQKKFKYNFIN